MVNANVNPEASFTFILFIFLIPAVLFIIYWQLTKKTSRNEQH
jgi:cbb3-type cytochrome oxidase subunit 3